jgi:predicted phage baseplate assembly protein
MTLPAPNLDDLRFQSDLVDEARKRIIHYCPEWTEYNLSDPGITLIELFAWMTEMMLYRVNRVPEKNYIKFLEMLGLQRKPASSSTTEMTFWLSAPLPFSTDRDQVVSVPEAFEVRSDLSEQETLFTTNRKLDIVSPLLTQVRREKEFNKNYLSRLGVEIFHPFNQPAPQMGDTFYLGFDAKHDINGHILQLGFTCDPTEAVGIRRDDPPWVWECMDKDGRWIEITPSKFEGEKDTTGGLNNERGSLVFYLPLTLAPGLLYGLSAFWLRCRIEQRNPLQGMYSESPRVKQIDAFSLGATIPATHSVRVSEEVLGKSKGEAGQSFVSKHQPILTLLTGETVEVEESRDGDVVFVPWKQVIDFSASTQYDRHFVLDNASGTISFGPSVRQPDGTVIQYGRIPESGRDIRLSRYRYGGGVSGNLPIAALNTLTQAIPYVARVSNLVRAVGGQDQETIDELKLRAQRELQAQRRAVTAQDYEQFTKNSSRSVARAKCLTPNDQANGVTGTVTVMIVPAVADSLAANGLAALHLTDEFQAMVRSYLDQYRLLTTSLHIREPKYIGVKVKATIVPEDFHQPAKVQRQVIDELNRYLAPLAMDDKKPISQAMEKWEGWPFGRDLFLAEVISLIQQVPQVKYVLDVSVSSRVVTPLDERKLFDDSPAPLLTPVEKVLLVPEDGLICSLDHEIEIITVQDLYKKDKNQ